MKLNFNLNYIHILLLANNWQVGNLQAIDRSLVHHRAEIAAQKKRTMRVCNSTCRLAARSDTQNNRLLVFGILSSNIALTRLAIERNPDEATVASIELFKSDYMTGGAMNFDQPFSRTDATMPFLASYIAGARSTVASHTVRSAVVTLCYRNLERQLREATGTVYRIR